jgi:hypothetical protein
MNENIKNICDFPYALNIEKCFRQKIFYSKMISHKIFSSKIISHKIFYDKNYFIPKQMEHQGKWLTEAVK